MSTGENAGIHKALEEMMGLGQAVFCLKIWPAGGFSFQIGQKVLFVFLLVTFRIKNNNLTDSKLLSSNRVANKQTT